MWLRSLFYETPVDFEKRCKNRIAVSIGIAVLGAVAMLFSVLFRAKLMQVSGSDSLHMGPFYSGVGAALFVAGILKAIQNYRYLHNDKVKKVQKIKETDERNRMLGLRCWAFAGYTFFLSLYVGILISGLFSVLICKVLMVTGVFFALLLFLFRLILEREM